MKEYRTLEDVYSYWLKNQTSLRRNLPELQHNFGMFVDYARKHYRVI